MRNFCGTTSRLLPSSFIVLVFLLSSAAPSPLQAAPTAHLVDDLATVRAGNVGAEQITPVGSKVFFEGFEVGSGGELWVTDRTTNGTRLLVDLCPGPCSSDVQLFGGIGGVLIFAVPNRDASELQLWRSDGTRPGTFSLTERFGVTRREFGVPYGVFFGDAFFFQACSDVRCELWRTDGSRNGTGLFLTAEEESQFFGEMVVAAGRLFFVAGSFRDLSLWISDGTPGGTSPIRQFEFARFLTAAADRVYFTVEEEGESLWTSDGTTQGTYPVSNVILTISSFQLFWRETSGNRIYFKGNDIVHGEEIWMSDGSRSGTRRVTDLADPDPFSDTPPRVLGERVIFTATDGFSGYHLGSTMGDPASTTLLADPCDNCAWYSVRLHAARGHVFFVLYDSIHGQEVWSSDGTAAGTQLVKDVCPGSCFSVSHETPFFETSTGIVFTATDARNIANLWKSDGTPQGTQPLTDFDEPFLSPTGPSARAIGESLLFFSQSPQGPTLWRSEGLREPQPIVVFGMTNASSFPSELTVVGDRLFFTACDGTKNRIWETSGAAGTTHPVFPELSWLCFDTLPRPLIPVGSRLLLWANPGDRSGLWAVDGTSAGTTLLLEGVYPHFPIDTAIAAGWLYFRASGQSATEIWRTDGTPGGTARVAIIPQTIDGPLTAIGSDIFFLSSGPDERTLWLLAAGSAVPKDLGRVELFTQDGLEMERLGSQIVFTARTPLHEGGLWVTDRTRAGTRPLFGQDEGFSPSNLTLFQGAIYFLTEMGLWRTDGTTEGTRLVRDFASRAELTNLTATSNRLFFIAHDPDRGQELWTSNGTPNGTTLLRPLPQQMLGEHPELFAVGDKLFFAAHDGAHGMELWQSDGTAEGTHMVQDIAPEASSSVPQDFTAAGPQLYFTADDGLAGRELWAFPLTGASGCQTTSTRLCLTGGRFQVEADWRDFRGNTGVGTAVSLTGDTGYFWFFDPANAEVVLKVLDGRGLNGHFWVFYGALSSVEYALTVTDTETGLARRYLNPSGQLASVGDTRGFGPSGAHSATPEALVASPSPPALVSGRTEPAAATGTCTPGSQRLCLNGGRFAVEASWKDFQGHTGRGTAVPLTSDTGWFWFFDSSNVEVMLKVLDGTPLNGKFWVFYGALSNVEYTLTVTDTQTGAVKEYRNPSGRFASVADTAAF